MLRRDRANVYAMDTDPAISELLSFFDFAHLQERTPHLAAASEPFYFAAHALDAMGTDGDAYLADLAEDSPGNEGAEARFKVSRAREALASKAIGGIGPALRLLLEAKDCAVRAALVRHRAEQAGGLTSSKTVAVADLPGLLAGIERLRG